MQVVSFHRVIVRNNNYNTLLGTIHDLGTPDKEYYLLMVTVH